MQSTPYIFKKKPPVPTLFGGKGVKNSLHQFQIYFENRASMTNNNTNKTYFHDITYYLKLS